MRTRLLSIPLCLIVILMMFVSVFGTVSVARAQTAPAPATTGAAAPAAAPAVPADRRFQVPGATSCAPWNFEFIRCIGAPLAIWASDGLISMGAKTLELAGSLFDFGVDRLIMNFKDTL